MRLTAGRASPPPLRGHPTPRTPLPKQGTLHFCGPLFAIAHTEVFDPRFARLEIPGTLLRGGERGTSNLLRRGRGAPPLRGSPPSPLDGLRPPLGRVPPPRFAGLSPPPGGGAPAAPGGAAKYRLPLHLAAQLKT
jgi:hypothetical protein